MPERRVEELIDNSFRRYLGESLPSLRELLKIVKENPEKITPSLSDKFFTKISDMADLTLKQLEFIMNISQEIVRNHGISSIPIEKMLDGLNTHAITAVLSVNPIFLEEDKERYVTLLFQTLIKLNKKEHVTYNQLIKLLVSVNGDLVSGLCKDQLRRYDWKILGPITILSQIGDESICSNMLEILKNTLMGINYEDATKDIHMCILSYLQKTRCKDSTSLLLELMGVYEGHNDVLSEIARALAFNDSDVIEPILTFMENQIRLHKFLIVQNLLTALNIMEITDIQQIDYDRLLKIIHSEPYRFIGYDTFVELTIKMDDSVDAILSYMLNSQDKREYEFSRECLKKRGKDIYEILGKNPVLHMYDIFFNQLTPRKEGFSLEQPLLDESFRPNFPQKDTFEQAVESLLASCGFTTIWVDPSGVPCVDIVAFSKDKKHAFLIGCTTGVIKDDLDKIFEVSKKITAEIDDCKIHPLLCVKSRKGEIMRLEDAYKNKIGILSIDELSRILELSRVGRPHEEILAYIRAKSIDLMMR